MITTFFLSVLIAVAGTFLAFLPVGALPAGIIQAIGYLWGVLNLFSYVFPVGTLLAALMIVLGFDFAVLLWHFIQWVIRKIPFVK